MSAEWIVTCLIFAGILIPAFSLREERPSVIPVPVGTTRPGKNRRR
ncbi:hypothetical protein D3OALGA1CA_2340 [Olavius algarvensis associated proteobacterium Delta 3]|nr:hypothetical protein D3OALGB2SA_240 [Olavius algarvensis associated proteobacterium Delta 3]CAB5117176.1 hypothetical protein D3OALGA1CA_2340 [Olavius algarvensis associated proteobacterium Delta 3]